jgi:hypothetical protein
MNGISENAAAWNFDAETHIAHFAWKVVLAVQDNLNGRCRSGLESPVTTAYSPWMNEIRPSRRRRVETKPDVAPPGTPLHIAVAPGMLDREHTVVREPGESDERYRSRCDLFAALLDYAREGSA